MNKAKTKEISALVGKTISLTQIRKDYLSIKFTDGSSILIAPELFGVDIRTKVDLKHSKM